MLADVKIRTMPSSPPFVDSETGELNTSRIVAEAIPLAKLVGLVAAVALVPLLPLLLGIRSGIGLVFTLAGQFVLAVGSGVVLTYVVARGIQLAEA